MASDMNMTVKPYDYDVVDDLFPVLFITNNTREDGLTEIPAASLQMVVSALELIRWEVRGADHEIIKETIGIIAGLRDMQKNRERKREDQ